jgi:hypothetical protein
MSGPKVRALPSDQYVAKFSVATFTNRGGKRQTQTGLHKPEFVARTRTQALRTATKESPSIGSFRNCTQRV